MRVIRAGQSAEIKVDTFSFTKYGLLHGTVTDVSADSIDRNKPPTSDKKTPSSDSASEPTGHELVYATHIKLDQTSMEVDGKDVPLTPGMAVTAEIKTGAQRIISYLLSPLLRYKQESLHERLARPIDKILRRFRQNPPRHGHSRNPLGPITSKRRSTTCRSPGVSPRR